MNIKDYMKELAEYDFAEYFGGYEGGYIEDIIHEVADSDISINTQNQIDYAINHDDSVMEVFANGLAPNAENWMETNECFYSYIAAVGTAAWYNDNYNTIKRNLKECALYAVVTCLKNRYNITELTDEQIDNLECCLDIDIDKYIEDIIDKAVEIINSNNEEDK